MIALSLFAGAFNVEIFRAGIEAVPRDDASRPPSRSASAGCKAYVCVIVLPLAFRISLPALNNNLVNLSRPRRSPMRSPCRRCSTSSNQIWSDELNVPEMMNVLLISMSAWSASWSTR